MQLVAARPDSFAAVLHDEDRMRAAFYGLLAVLLSKAPDDDVLKAVRSLQAGDGALGRSVATLVHAAALATPKGLAQEYHDLFIGLGRGELVPFGSYYLTGFLQEKPLARLRQDMARLGIMAAAETSDPEDHASSILDMMAGSIEGRFGTPLDVAGQSNFFQQHIASWMPIFFLDLERVASSSFYAAVGSAGRAFLEIESAAFDMGT